VILTIWDADAETKVYWKSPDGNARTTIMPGKGIQTFQTVGQFSVPVANLIRLARGSESAESLVR
jgi:hypothetical protein